MYREDHLIGGHVIMLTRKPEGDEYLVHGVDVEGKREGVEKELVRILGEWCKTSGVPTLKNFK
jgi:hypothetical protein